LLSQVLVMNVQSAALGADTPSTKPHSSSSAPEPAARPERSELAVRTQELLARARDCTSSDERRTLEDEIVRLNLPLARSLASAFSGRGLPLDDLVQVASLGLLKAVRGFDPDKGFEFLAYAVPTIRGEIRRHFRDAGWTVRPPRRIQELQARVWAADAALTQTLQRRPTVPELAEELGVDPTELVEVWQAEGCFTPSSLDLGDETGTVGDRLGDSDNGYDVVEARLVIDQALRSLSDRDRTIVQLRFREEWSQKQIGEVVGVSQMQVSRLLTRILADLRDTLTSAA
jgi:RNA polymerase sigma-B factor